MVELYALDNIFKKATSLKSQILIYGIEIPKIRMMRDNSGLNVFSECFVHQYQVSSAHSLFLTHLNTQFTQV